jgi:hypothetical protein
MVIHVMSSDKIITVHNLGKKYSLRHQRNEPYRALRHVLTDHAKNPFRRNGNRTSATEDFWALKEENYDEAHLFRGSMREVSHPSLSVL